MITMMSNEYRTGNRQRTGLLAVVSLATALAAHAAALPIVSYSYESGNLTVFPDTGGTELTDGVFAPSASFGNSQFVGAQDDPPDDGVGQPAILFNLGGANQVESVVISYLHSSIQAAGTITAPESAEISFSLDGVAFTSPLVFTTEFDSSGGDAVRLATLDFTDTVAKFVRVDIRNSVGGASPGQWTFLDEVAIHGAVPEPASYGLAAGAVLLAFASWRKRTRKQLA